MKTSVRPTSWQWPEAALLLLLRQRLTCPFDRILLSSADDFFKLEETVAQYSCITLTITFFHKLIQATPCAPASSPVVGCGVWDSVSAVISWVWSCVNLRAQKTHIHKWYPHKRVQKCTQTVQGQRDRQTWPDLVMNKKKALSSA